MHSLLRDLRYTLRQLVKSRGFTLTAILSLACGIAATTAVFSVVWAVVMNPYPYAAADRMVHFSISAVNSNGYNGFPVTGAQWQQLRNVPAIEDSILINQRRMTLSGNELPEDVRGSEMSANAFNFFGVPALLGRGLVPSDAPDGHDPQPVAVLSYRFWQRRFNGDRGILGKTIQLEHKPYQVVGVAARRFTWNDADIYLPLKTTADPTALYDLEARLKPGVSHQVAAQQLQPLATQFIKESPRSFPPRPGPLTVIGLNEQYLQALGPTLAMLFGAVLLLLAVGCGNVSILLLARGAAREHEFAVRAAIGASRGRIVRQLLTEALLLSVTGAALGVLLAYKLLAVIVALLPEYSFPHEASIEINLPVLLFSVCVALLTGILFGLWPALRLSRADARLAMQTGTHKVAGSARGRVLYNCLIAGQIALTLLLLSTAGAAIESFLKLAHAQLGYDPHHVIALGIPIRIAAHTSLPARVAYAEALRNQVAGTPGVQMAAYGSTAVPPSNGIDTPIDLLGLPSSEERKARMSFVSEGYFPLMRVPLRQGRLWTEAENHNAAKVVVINQTLARQYFPSGDALSHSLRVGILTAPPPFVTVAPGGDGWLQVIGIVEDKLNDGLRSPVRPEFYLPYTLGMWNYAALLVRTDGPPSALLHTLGLRIASIDRDQQVETENRDLEQIISMQPEYAQGQLISYLFGAFAVLALLLAAVGLYSVVSYTVARRTNEFGIRLALGASRSNVLELVFRSTALSVGSGVAAGLLLTLVLHRVLVHWAAAGESAWAALFGSVAILAVVAVVAGGIPARRAAEIEPMEALRYE
jgi:putative ABC transport system permease protein